MQNCFSLNREFIRWFYEDQYPTRASNRAAVYEFSPTKNADQRDYWMRQAFKAGAEAMAHKIICGLESSTQETAALLELKEVAGHADLTYYEQIKLFK